MIFIEIKNLKKYFNKIKAVDNVSFNIESGQIFGLLGPNGAGKSTLISILTTILEPDNGIVKIKGYDLKKEAKKIKPLIGFVPQEIALYPTLTAIENLNFWGKMYGIKGKKLKERIEFALELTGLKARSKDRIEKYSGGMKRRINIACALLHNPELIIMDEPTVGIDTQSRKNILETVLNLNKAGITVIYTSHYMEEVEFLCSKIAIMDSGKILSIGTKDELTASINSMDKINIELKDFCPKIEEKLKILENISNVIVNNKDVTIISKDSDTALADIIRTIEINNCKIHTITIDTPNLENVFLHLTGRDLRD
ncbi:MAG: ABC transporter ATP-binding protein [Clostridiales bacterium]